MKPWVIKTIVGAALVAIVGSAIGFPGSWVIKVNANDKDHSERLIKLETYVPTMAEDVREIKEDVKELRRRR